MHSDGELGVVGELFRAHLHVATIDNDVLGIECAVMSLVTLVRLKDQRPLYHKEGKNWGRVNIDKKTAARKNFNGITLLGKEVTSPGASVGPQGNISVDKTLRGDITDSSNVDFQGRVMLLDKFNWLVLRSASDVSVRLVSHCAL